MSEVRLYGGGESGRSAYEEYVVVQTAAGQPVLSKSAWLASLKGDPGVIINPDAVAWDNATLYKTTAVVTDAGSAWIARRSTTGERPSLSPDAWEVLVPGVDLDFAAQAVADVEAAGAGQIALAAAQTALAQGSAAAAQSAEANAVAAQAAAEVARDAAAAAADIYADTTAGIAGTAIGEQFGVVVGAYIYRYRHDAGPVATEVARYPSAELVDSKLTVTQRPSRKWVFTFGDIQNRIVWGITTLGEFLAKGVDVTDLFSAAGVERNRLAGYLAEGARRSKYTHAMTDAQGRVGLGLTRNKRFHLFGQDVTDNLDGTLSGRVAAVEALAASTASVVCWGDSLTEGAGSTGGQTYPVQLSALLGEAVTNLGKGSQTADQITARTGARAALLTVTGDEIPASGAVAVTARSIDLCYYAGASLSVQGWLAGVFGTLTKVTSAGASSPLVSYTFTRAEAGAAVPCLPGTPFIPSSVYPDRTHVIWIGRNDYSGVSGVTDAGALVAVNDRIKTNIAAIIGAMSTVGKRVIILGVTAKASADEYVGTGNFDAKRDLAADLARDYPRSFIDIDAILRRNGDSSPSDDADIANGVVPGSLRHDLVHLNNSGYAIVAAEIATRMMQNGWT